MKLKDCYKKYKDKLIFENISYTFINKIYWLKGKNGVGKSVLLRCLAKIEEFSGGIFESDKKNILFIPEFSLNEDWLTLKENIKLLMYFHKLTLQEKELEEILDRLNLNNNDDILASKASLGTNIKTSLALIFIKNHWDLIIIDEALAHIDKQTQQVIFQELNERTKEHATVIFTHHSELAIERGDLDIVTITLEPGGLH